MARRETLFMAGALLVTVVCFGSAKGQGRTACPTPSSNDCYFQGAATLPPNEPSPNKRFIIGGFFDIHKPGADAYTCSAEVDEEGMLYLQAFLWAIKTYSALRLGGTGISVGSFAFDSCGRAEQNVENMLSYAQCKIYLQDLPQTNLVAYVGPYRSDHVMSVASLATDLSVPLLAPVANSPDLGSSTFLQKMSPSFSRDVQSIFSLLRALRVDYAILLYDQTDPMWVAAFNSLSMMLTGSATCVHYTRAYVESELSDVVDALEARQMVRYVVPLMSRDKLGRLIDGVRGRSQIQANSFRFILTSDIGQDRTFMTSKSASANNSLIIEPAGPQDYLLAVQNFAQALAGSSTGQVGTEDVAWITNYYSTRRSEITAATPSRVRYALAKTLQAVDNIMKAMVDVINSPECGGQPYQICENYRNLANKGDALLAKISAQVGVPSNDFSVIHYYVDNSGPVFDKVADISENNGVMQTTLLKPLLDNSQYGTQFSDSACPSFGECCIPPTTEPPAPVATDPPMTDKPTEDPSSSKMVVAYYPRGQEITGAYFDAERDSGEYGTRFDLNHKWIIAIGVLGGLGILSVLIFEIYILYKLLGTRMGNKWRTMWLGQLLLFGVLLCYLTLFAYIPIPTKATCGITRFGVGVSYSVCFAVLLVKLMVILTSRTSTDVLLPGDVESPNYLKGIYQFLMFIFAVGVQIVINVQWLITVPPEAVPVISNTGDKVWVCNHYTWEAGKDMDRMDGWIRTNFENHVLSLTYIMVLILITTILSLNAHGIITNHRESVFIGIAAGFSIPIWLAWTLVGGLNDDHSYAQEFGDACVAFGLFLTATLILFAMFLPKVRQLVNMGVEGIYLEDDRDTYYAGSVIMAPPSYKGKGPNSVIYVNNQGIYSEPVVIGNGDPTATHLRHPGSTYSAPPAFVKKADSTYGGSRVLRVTDDLKGRHPQKPKTQSEAGYGTNPRPRSARGTLQRSRSHTSLGAL